MDRFKYLFNQYVSKTATAAERMEFQNMLQKDKYDDELKDLLEAHIANFQAGKDEFFLPLGDDLLKSILSSPNVEIGAKKPVIRNLWTRIAAAASFILIASISFYFYKQAHTIKNDPPLTSVENSRSGGNGATLTLANGKKIRLTDVRSGQLGIEAGINITKTADGKIVYEVKDLKSNSDRTNSLSTGKGETYQLRLPDGSSVWLNSASSITYNISLNEHGKRVLSLIGEAYFEIAKDEAHPFVVKTNNQEIQVLGTHFNVMAYPDEHYVRTTLLEGSVSLTAKNEKRLLKPGESAINNVLTNKIDVEAVDADDAIAWKNGYFNFDNETIGDIMKQVSRWYDVDVEFDDTDLSRVYWVANYPRSASLEGLLKSLELTGGVHFKIQGRRVIVMK